MRLWKITLYSMLLIMLALAGCTNQGSPGDTTDPSQVGQEQDGSEDQNDQGEQSDPDRQPGNNGTDQNGLPIGNGDQTDGDGQSADNDGPAEGRTVELAELGSESVMINLSTEKRLASPIQTVVAPGRQMFVVQFAEAMKRDTVESSIRANLTAPEETDLKFTWQNDKLLYLEVDVPPATEATMDDFGQRTYMIDVQGAVTQSEKRLQSTPVFRAAIVASKQMWRISADGQQKELLTSVNDSVDYRKLPFTEQYVMTVRFQEYCECDATLPYLYGIYDVKDRTWTKYPLDIVQNYTGDGRFYADLRGFFYAQPAVNMIVPDHDQSVPIDIVGYVHGSAFSQDGRYVIAAVGHSNEQNKDLDLVIVNLQTGEEKRLDQVIKGQLEQSMVSSAMLPVQFQDNGKDVYFSMMDPNSQDPIPTQYRYQYNWETGEVGTWDVPVRPDEWVNFSSSSDGIYTLYANGGLYKNGERLDLDIMAYPVYWLHGTHTFAMMEYVELADDYVIRLTLYDADEDRTSTIIDALPLNTNVVGTSMDGQWIYVQTSHTF